MTSPAANPDAAPTCCGEGGTWAPKAGSPQVVGCMLCPGADARYWRNDRADGRPYVEVKALVEE